MFHARAVIWSDAHHVRSDQLPDVRHRHDLFPTSGDDRPRHGTQRRRGRSSRCRGSSGRWSRRAPRSDRVHHILLRDPPTGPAPRDLGEIEVMLLGQLPNERRKDLRPRPPVGQRRSRDRSRRRRCRSRDRRRGGGRGGPWSRGADRVSSDRLLRRGGIVRRRRRPGGAPVTRCRPIPGVDLCQCRPHRHRCPFRDEDLRHGPRHGRRHLGVDLVRRQLEERLVHVDVLAFLLQPLQDRALDDGLAELGHLDRRHFIASRTLTMRRGGRPPPRSLTPGG